MSDKTSAQQDEREAVIQVVKDNADGIFWRGNYYGLPISSQQVQADAGAVAWYCEADDGDWLFNTQNCFPGGHKGQPLYTRPEAESDKRDSADATEQPGYQQLLDAMTAAVIVPEDCAVAISVQKFCDAIGMNYLKAMGAAANDKRITILTEDLRIDLAAISEAIAHGELEKAQTWIREILTLDRAAMSREQGEDK